MNALLTHQYDVVVIGGGNAGLCAAITAAEAGCSVVIVEVAAAEYRGGNSRHTRNFRCMHKQPVGPLVDAYLEDEYVQDLLKVTGGKTDRTLAQMTILNSEECLHWMMEHGVRFQPSLAGTLSLARTNAFFLGGGKALVNAYYRTAESLGVKVIYQAKATHLELQGNTIKSVSVEYNGSEYLLSARAVIVTAGGFQANLEWLTKAWGPAAENFLIRGTPYNRGEVLADLSEQGVKTIGDQTQCHAVAIDGRAPKFDGGIVTRLDCVPFSVVVNKHAQRFYDEGQDVWPKRYAIWGRLVADQPDQVGYVIIDSKAIDLFMPSVFPPVQADSLEALARALELPVATFVETINRYNNACPAADGFMATELDGLSTRELDPPKTNWARAIAQPPFYAYTIRPGVTFTYWGLQVDSNAQCSTDSGVVANLWAAGETMAGSILGQGYLAGFGMTIGTVFGRIAGSQAAQYVQ